MGFRVEYPIQESVMLNQKNRYSVVSSPTVRGAHSFCTDCINTASPRSAARRKMSPWFTGRWTSSNTAITIPCNTTCVITRNWPTKPSRSEMTNRWMSFWKRPLDIWQNCKIWKICWRNESKFHSSIKPTSGSLVICRKVTARVLFRDLLRLLNQYN